jgi:hypothetical protein
MRVTWAHAQPVSEPIETHGSSMILEKSNGSRMLEPPTIAPYIRIRT